VCESGGLNRNVSALACLLLRCSPQVSGTYSRGPNNPFLFSRHPPRPLPPSGIWDISGDGSSGRCVRSLAGHAAPIVSIEADRDRILSTSFDGTLRVWGWDGTQVRGATGLPTAPFVKQTWALSNGTSYPVLVSHSVGQVRPVHLPLTLVRAPACCALSTQGPHSTLFRTHTRIAPSLPRACPLPRPPPSCPTVHSPEWS
jgi:hypothetical protein